MSNKFEDFYKIDVSKFTEKKGKYTYLSWAYAWKFIKEQYEDASFVVHEYNDAPYMKTELEYFVKVSATANNITHSQTHPVLDFQNNAMTSPTSFDINKSIQRCLAKAIALHGLGLGLWINEDICDSQSEQPKTEYKKADKPKDSPEDTKKAKDAIHDLLKDYTPEQKKDLLKKATYWEKNDSYCDDINNLTIKGRDPSVNQMRVWYKKIQQAMLSTADFVSDEL
ncbi:MAG TPA: DUF1071 domain-containing protein [Xanthomarina gelatinilytica]|uniref:DUF1071 domain-containing protein n=1 Tax=Xanthomarina gelatinilytica TaxID=1137281 RepID=A0A3D6BPI6_9FLAO|nr:DUF1071 domain-containing protein [Xanthomarina gelatinilytica]